MSKLKEYLKFILITGVFLIAFFMPVLNPDVQESILSFLKFLNPKVGLAILESLILLNDYAREHVLLCLVPAFFIAGGISVFVSQASVLKYFGAKAKKWIAYSVASVSGTVLAVCSCTILPLFAGIYKRGAGLGPAIAFLYAGPAINILAIILTGRVLGMELAVVRTLGAVVFAIVIGLLMQLIHGREEDVRQQDYADMPVPEDRRHLWQYGIYFGSMAGILISATWANPNASVDVIAANPVLGFWVVVFKIKWYLVLFFGAVLALSLKKWFEKDEKMEWVEQTWEFAKLILPLLFAGVIVSGFLLGRPGTDNGIIPSAWIAGLVGGNSIQANFIAAISGALMYFATLTEVPIMQGLLGAGMGKGPALALLLAGPALSLPSMLVIRSIIGTKKTITYIALVVLMSSIAGFIYGSLP